MMFVLIVLFHVSDQEADIVVGIDSVLDSILIDSQSGDRVVSLGNPFSSLNNLVLHSLELLTLDASDYNLALGTK